MGIPMLKIRWSWSRLIFNMAIPILVRRHLYFETARRAQHLLKPFLPNFLSFEYFKTDSIKFWRKLCQNQPVWLSILLAPGCQAMKYVKPCSVTKKYHLIIFYLILSEIYESIWCHLAMLRQVRDLSLISNQGSSPEQWTIVIESCYWILLKTSLWWLFNVLLTVQNSPIVAIAKSLSTSCTV